MKKFYVYAMGALILPFLASCGDDKEDSGYTGVNLIYLSAENPVVEETEATPLTVNVDLTGKQVAGEDAEKKIINHGNLTLIDSGTGSTLSIPIENNGTLNANGGTVTGEVTNKGTITTTGEKATQFSGGVTNESDGKIENGTFSGEVTNNRAIIPKPSSPTPP